MKQYFCEKCGSIDVFTEKHGPHIGLYCKDCGEWIKWLSKKEVQLVQRYINSKNESEEI